ncbi:TonB family protein [Aquabacterium lacunae]|uniref:TonB family protein n=1 Tax=Aquabacterium lacunae TaxID=2528630 RepID=A0A4Q9H2X1_9BURK|nr:TonB family protein [Aquabacterium lacunae]TBO29442.1 TonB family protein [Aquabacterium lacunae]
MSAMLQPREPEADGRIDLSAPTRSPWPDDDLADAPRGTSARAWALGLVGLMLLGGLVYLGFQSLGQGSSAPKRQTVKIAVLPDTPPPPPPPPKEEIKPQPKPEDAPPQPQEQKVVEAPPEPQQLKMEGAAGDGPSAFGSGSVTREYEKGEIGGGSGGGTVNKLQFSLFTSQLQRHISSALAKDPTIKLGDYRVRVSVHLDPSGAFRQASLESSTGDAALDRALEAALMRLPPMRDVPAQLPQPISLRITNRMTG